MPRVALLSGAGTSANDVGETWFLLNERMGIPVSLLDVDRVERADLARYNTIVMAGYNAGLSAAGAERLKAWVRGGGLARRARQLGALADRRGARRRAAEGVATRYHHRVAYATCGAPLRRAGDRRHHLRGGARHDASARHRLRRAGGALPREHVFLQPSRTPGANAGVYTDDPLLSGYVSDARLGELRGSAAVVARRVGRGSVVLMPDNPNFRAFWYGTNGFFLNAVFFGAGRKPESGIARAGGDGVGERRSRGEGGSDAGAPVAPVLLVGRRLRAVNGTARRHPPELSSAGPRNQV
jgi:hypothetical protein